MASVLHERLFPFLRWLCGSGSGRLVLACCVMLIGPARRYLPWRRPRGSLDDPERNRESKRQTPSPKEEEEEEEDVRESQRAGQPEASARERDADSPRRSEEEVTECHHEGQPATEAREGDADSPRRSEEEIPESQHEGQPEAEAREGDADSPRSSEEDEDEFDSEEYRVPTSDELYCDYDSTWETEEDQDERQTSRRSRPAAAHHKFHRFEVAARDMQNYRHDYPTQINPYRWNQHTRSQDDKPNLRFYLGERSSKPNDVYISDFHDDWKGDYSSLEHEHAYIQWLFPLQEPGVNSEARTLTKGEIEEFLHSSPAKENLLKSYLLMLDFYGIELRDRRTGEVTRASNWKSRFRNLNSHTHNSLRITRILKCLGNLGYRHYQAPLVRFFLHETLVEKELPHIKDSVLSYFLFAVLDREERRRLLKFAYLHYEPKGEFVWCPRKIQAAWSARLRKGKKKGREERAPAGPGPNAEGEPRKKQLRLSDASDGGAAPEDLPSYQLVDERDAEHGGGADVGGGVEVDERVPPVHTATDVNIV